MLFMEYLYCSGTSPLKKVFILTYLIVIRKVTHRPQLCWNSPYSLQINTVRHFTCCCLYNGCKSMHCVCPHHHSYTMTCATHLEPGIKSKIYTIFIQSILYKIDNIECNYIFAVCASKHVKSLNSGIYMSIQTRYKQLKAKCSLPTNMVSHVPHRKCSSVFCTKEIDMLWHSTFLWKSDFNSLTQNFSQQHVTWNLHITL